LRNLGTVLVAGALLVGLAACGDDDDDDAGGATTTAAGATTTAASGESKCGDLSAVTKMEGLPAFTPTSDGTFTLVTSLPGPGFFDGGDTPDKVNAGVEYCMGQVMARMLGLEMELRNETFQSITTGVVQDYDLALSQSSITDERKEVVDFTEPYYKSDQGILAETGTTVATLDDAKKLLYAVQTGTTGEYFVTDIVKPEQQPQVFQDLNGAYTALAAGQVDAVMMDTAINLGQAARSNGTLAVVAQFANEDYYGGIVPKGSTNLDAINAMLKQMEDDGTLTELIALNLGGDPTKVPFIEV
jgi:polar amino acid transport system substrate-binding protein